MANKTVGELPRATTVTTTDLFVMEQAGQAKSLTGQTLINDLADALDGHGGIKSITLNSDYTLTFVLSDDTEVTTTSVRGEKGAKGDKGTDGKAITAVTKISTSGLVDTYKITFSDNTSTNFTVTNGSSIQSIEKTSTSGLVDTYTVTLTDDTTSTFAVKNGNGISAIALQSGTHAAGTSDVYKITFDNGEFTTFSVYNGMNGSGSVSTVNLTSPDASGNVNLTAGSISISASDAKTVADAIAERQPATKDLTASTALADGDYLPFYDDSASANRKTLWSTVITKIRTALFGTSNGLLKANGSGVITAISTVPVDAGGTGATSAATARANLGAEQKKLIFTNTSVAKTAFVSSTTYKDYPYRAAVALSNVVSSMIPDIVLAVSDAAGGNFAPVAETYNGGVYIYAKEAPSAAITIPTIICWRGE